MASLAEVENKGTKRTATVSHSNKRSFPLSKRPKRSQTEEHSSVLSETSYVLHNGLRYVRPYYFTFKTHAKRRWVGRKVYDIFCEEFQSETSQYYEKAIKLGKVAVNGKVATMETVVKDNDFITHLIHRHEPPVTGTPLSIIHQDNELIVINKPASIPVHPCGRYRHNSVLFILAKEHNLNNLHTPHRLDRLTSGLLLFGKTISKAQEIDQQIKERKVTKEYLALVKGHFPKETIECAEPIKVESHKIGLCHVNQSGKPCSTVFSLISHKDGISLVKCQPKTGRMHQIRVHLQWLGYPIVNDPLYNHYAWGPERGKGGQSHKDIKTILAELIKDRFGGTCTQTVNDSDDITASERDITSEEKEIGNGKEGNRKQELAVVVDEQQQKKEVIETTNTQTPDHKKQLGNTLHGSHDDGNHDDTTQQPFDYSKDPNCTECHTPHTDPALNECMYLHALKYKGESWEYTTDPPHWARDYLNIEN